MWYTYVLESQKNKRLYTGITNNLPSKLEEKYQVDIPDNEPVIRFPNQLNDAVGRHVSGEGVGVPDTLKYNIQHVYEKLSEREVSVLVDHERIHEWGYFNTTGQEGELPVGNGYGNGNRTEGVTDLLARREHLGQDEVGLGYPQEVANWGNICYMLGYDPNKSPDECFNEGTDLLGHSFLGEHSIKPIMDRLKQVCRDKLPENDFRFLLDAIFMSGNNPAESGRIKYKILHGAEKISYINFLASMTGIDLVNNQKNIRNLGVSEEIFQKSINSEQEEASTEDAVTEQATSEPTEETEATKK